jgi:hypothetical protein
VGSAAAVDDGGRWAGGRAVVGSWVLYQQWSVAAGRQMAAAVVGKRRREASTTLMAQLAMVVVGDGG